MYKHNVVIVGAGIGGLTTALFLHKHGIRSEIYEFGRRDSRKWASGSISFLMRCSDWMNSILDPPWPRWE